MAAGEEEEEVREMNEEEPQPVTVSQPDPDEEAVVLGGMTNEQRQARREMKRPRIDHLDMAVAVAEVDGKEDLVALFEPGDRIVCERRSDHLGGAWLDTRVLVVRSIDDDTGVVWCRDPDLGQLTAVSFKDPLHDLRLPPPRGNPFAAPRRARQPQENGPAPIAQGGGKKRAGRPKGSKNRPKAEVEAEKARRGGAR